MLIAEILPNKQISLSDTVVADSIKHEKVKFIFSSEWEGYQKTVVFGYDEQSYNVVLNAQNDLCTALDECYIPFEVLKPPYFTVSVFGVLSDSRITTTKVKVKVLESGYQEGEIPEKPTPDEYSQILQIAASAEEIARKVKEDAENGVFTGERGPQGEKGEDGKDGKDGTTQVIDQSFNPNSVNGQSGKAVAEALQNKQGKFATLLYEDELESDIPTGIKFDYLNPVIKTNEGVVLKFSPLMAGINSTFYVNEPTLDGHAATKRYVDEAIKAALNNQE